MAEGERGSVQGRRWPFLALPVLLAALLLLPLLAVAPEDRRIDTGHYLLAVLALIAAAAGGCALGWRRYGGDGFRFDATGLTTTSRRHGGRQLTWAQLRELGWVAHDGQGWGLACRLHAGGAYDVPGPHIAGWLAQAPGRRGHPPEVAALRVVAEQHGVAWRDYAPAEVLTATP